MKLTIVGGGGFRVPQVLEAISAPDAAVRIDTLALYDTDAARLRTMGAVLDQLAERLPRAPRIEAGDDLDTALAGADFIFSAIRVGGTSGRITDERIALDLGVLGQETTGPGGLAYALRTLPVMLSIAERVRRLSPEAWFINFTNPAGIVTEALRSVLGERVVGICDTPVGLLRRAALAVTGRPQASTVDYVGLNHLGWLRSFEVDGRDRLPELLADEARLATIEEARLMGLDWVRAIGALPNEYLYYYYFTREAVARIRGGAGTRGEFLHRQQEDFYQGAAAAPERALALWESTMAERNATYMAEARADGDDRDVQDLEGGYQRVALDVMAALASGRETSLILNVANGGVISGLPAEAVIEVPCTVSAAGIRPHQLAPVAGTMLGLMQSVKAVEELVIAAVRERSAELAWRAFAGHPLVDSVAIASELLARYRAAHPRIDAALTR